MAGTMMFGGRGSLDVCVLNEGHDRAELLLVNDADALLHISQNCGLIEKPVLSVRIEAVAPRDHAGTGGLGVLNEFLDLPHTTVDA